MSEPWHPGTRVEKINSVPGDAHQDGARGTITRHPVLGHAFGPANRDLPGVPEGTFAYFVEWDDMPGVPVGIVNARLRVIQ